MKNYKLIWDNLSPTFADAAYVVGFMSEEEEIQNNGKYTAEFLRSVLQIKPTDKVLEIGCGVARIGRELAPQCGEWHGSDISGNMVEYARKRTEGLPNVYLHELPETDLGIFNDGSFDCVYSTIVFMHLDKAEMFNYMCEAYRVLAPGGRAYFDTYNIGAPHAWEEFKTIMRTFALGKRPGHVSQFSTPQEMTKFMTEAGFSEIDVDDASPALVVARGVKPEQEDSERPTSVLNAEVVARGEARKQQIAETYRRARVKSSSSNEVPNYEDWLLILEDIGTKNDYIAQLETVLDKKDRHIAALESHVRKQDHMMRPLPVRVAMRISKPRR